LKTGSSAADIVEMDDADSAFIYAQRLAAIVEFSDDAILSKDLNGIINSWNRGAEMLFGYTAEETIGKPVTMLIPAHLQDEEPHILGQIRSGQRIDHYETVRRRKDGTFIDVSLTVSPIKDVSGKIISASKIARDISERKRAQEQRELLLRELSHRIKNTLATVQAIARQTLDSATEGQREAFFGRLRAMANAHELLTVEEWHRAPLAGIVERTLATFGGSMTDRIAFEGPDEIWLNAQQSSLLTMALHELVTNAAKYGALSNDAGHVRVEWALVDNDRPRLQLHWQETGGPIVKPPEKRGFGTRLIENAFTGEMGRARFDFAPKGLECTIEIVLQDASDIS
jgi:PAS domain S-box-containing protein